MELLEKHMAKGIKFLPGQIWRRNEDLNVSITRQKLEPRVASGNRPFLIIATNGFCRPGIVYGVPGIIKTEWGRFGLSEMNDPPKFAIGEEEYRIAVDQLTVLDIDQLQYYLGTVNEEILKEVTEDISKRLAVKFENTVEKPVELPAKKETEKKEEVKEAKDISDPILDWRNGKIDSKEASKYLGCTASKFLAKARTTQSMTKKELEEKFKNLPVEEILEIAAKNLKAARKTRIITLSSMATDVATIILGRPPIMGEGPTNTWSVPAYADMFYLGARLRDEDMQLIYNFSKGYKNILIRKFVETYGEKVYENYVKEVR